MSAINDGKPHKFLPFSMSITRKNYAINSQRDNMRERTAASIDGRDECSAFVNKSQINWQGTTGNHVSNYTVDHGSTERKSARNEIKKQQNGGLFQHRRIRDAKEDMNKIHINQVCVCVLLRDFFSFLLPNAFDEGLILRVGRRQTRKNLLFHC